MKVERLEASTRTVADAATAPGTAFMAFAHGGAVGPNDIVDIAAAVTELRVETAR